MIDYDPHDWDSHLFDIRGSMVREVLPRSLLCVAWSALVVWLCQNNIRLTVPLSAHSMMGFALGLLLVVRTNASYDRFWEGRKLWGSIINECRNVARSARTWLGSDPELLRQVLDWTSAFAHAAKNTLRGKVDLGPPGMRLPAAELAAVRQARHVPLAVSQRLTACLKQARDQGLISDIVYLGIDQNVQLLIDYLGGCERIHSTPLPYPYMVHLRRAIILYCLTLPFALSKDYGWSTLLATLLIAYLFFGVEEIGVEIEDPFGHDTNDLPLDLLCEKIDLSLASMLPLPAPNNPERDNLAAPE
jgi:putative membrane protein